MTDTVAVRFCTDDELTYTLDPFDPKATHATQGDIPRELFDRYVWAEAEWRKVQHDLSQYTFYAEEEPWRGVLD